MRYAPRGRYAFSLPRRDKEETLDFHFLLRPPGGSGMGGGVGWDGVGERRRWRREDAAPANATIAIASRVSRARALITPPADHPRTRSARAPRVSTTLLLPPPSSRPLPPDPVPDYHVGGPSESQTSLTRTGPSALQEFARVCGRCVYTYQRP